MDGRTKFAILTILSVGSAICSGTYIFYTCGGLRSDLNLHPVADKESSVSSNAALPASKEQRDSGGTQTWNLVSSRDRQQETGAVPRPLSAIATAVIQAPKISQSCKDGWEYLLTHDYTLMRDGARFGTTTLAMRAVDASGKPGAGVFEGNLFAYGSYDECLVTDHTQYCIVPFYYPQQIYQSIYRLGVCLPQECSDNDATLTAQKLFAVLQRVGVLANVGMSPKANLVHCETERYPPYTIGALIMILICCVLILAATVGTVIDWLSQTIFKQTRHHQN